MSSLQGRRQEAMHFMFWNWLCSKLHKNKSLLVSGRLPLREHLLYFSKVEKSEHYTECEIPEKLLLQAEGKRIFEEEQEYVRVDTLVFKFSHLCFQVIPVTKYPQEDVNRMSKQFCAQHLQKCMGVCRVIRVIYAPTESQSTTCSLLFSNAII